MALTGATYFIVHRSLLKRETAKVRDRLSSRTNVTDTVSSGTTPLFLPEGADQRRLFNRLLAKMNVDRQLQGLIEQAGVAWAPGQVCVASLLLALLAFNVVWYLLPLWQNVAFAAAPLAALLPFLYLRRRRKKRIAAFEAQFPDSLQFIARAMRAGHAFSVAYYLDEYTFRFNRRRSRHRGKLFYRLVQQAAAVGPTTYSEMVQHVRGRRISRPQDMG